MHSFLRAIGFSNVKSRLDFQKILGIIMENPTDYSETIMDNKTRFVGMSKEFMKNIGIGIVGEYDEKGFFYLGHYFPYCQGNCVSMQEDVSISKRVDTDAYTGMCDDMRFGVSMIFYLTISNPQCLLVSEKIILLFSLKVTLIFSDILS